MDRKTLKDMRTLEREIQQLEELITRIQARKTEPKNQKLTATPKGKGGAGDSTGSTLVLLEKLLDRYNEKRVSLINKRIAFEDAIDSLTSFERTIMRYSYIDCLKWNQIAKKMKYSEQHIKNVHWEAVKKIENSQC